MASPKLTTERVGEEREGRIQIERGSVHESSIVDPGVVIGAGSRIWHFCHICEGAKIGKEVIIGDYVYVGPEVEIGDRCRVQSHASLCEGVLLDEEVFIGSGTRFENIRNPRAFIRRHNAFLHTHVQAGASIGANCTIQGGLQLGRFCFVEGGTVLKNDVAAFGCIVSLPGLQDRWISREGNRQENRPGI